MSMNSIWKSVTQKRRKKMNNWIGIGRCTKKPELSYTPNTQTAVTKFTLAVDRMKRDEDPDFIRITVFGKQAESASRYLDKGSQCAVEGRIQTGSYEGQDGKKVYTTDVIANRVEFLGSPKKEKSQEPSGSESFADMGYQEADGVIPF